MEPLRLFAMAAWAAAGPALWAPLVMRESTSPSSRSMRFCMSSGEAAVPVLAALFLRLPGEAYVHDGASPRLVQLSQGWPRLHFSLQRQYSSHLGSEGSLLPVPARPA